MAKTTRATAKKKAAGKKRAATKKVASKKVAAKKVAAKKVAAKKVAEENKSVTADKFKPDPTVRNTKQTAASRERAAKTIRERNKAVAAEDGTEYGFGQALDYLMQAKEWSANRLAKESGLSRQAVYSAQKREPVPPTRKVILRALGVDEVLLFALMKIGAPGGAVTAAEKAVYIRTLMDRVDAI